MNQAASIKHVTLVGGTHGNEITGIECLKHWQEPKDKAFKLSRLLANTRAADEHKRFIDKDLNRCFSDLTLNDSGSAAAWEVQRAKQIIAQLNNPAEPTDFVIDLHTTTSNMGITLIFEHANWLTYTILDHVQSHLPNVRLMYEPAPTNGYSQYLISAAPLGMMIEVGPVAQNLLSATSFEQTVQALDLVMEAIGQYNRAITTTPSQMVNNTEDYLLEVFQASEMIHFPVDGHGQAQAYTHPDFQNQDFMALEKGMPIFKYYEGSEELYQGQTCYPVFINEAAYYNQQLAFTCTNKSLLSFAKPVPKQLVRRQFLETS